MSVLGLNSKDRKSTGDKANISNPKVNICCAPLTANRISADCVQISLGPSIPYQSTGGLPYWEIQRYGSPAMSRPQHHKRLHCLHWNITMGTWWRHQMETFSVLLALCQGNPPVYGRLPSQRPVTRNFDVFFDLLRLNKRLSKQSRRWWSETPSLWLWRHCNEVQERRDSSTWQWSYVFLSLTYRLELGTQRVLDA